MNPFSLTKSADMSDQLIHQLWVDIDKFGIIEKITSLNPVFLLGGKGSGKTHLLRHFSYQLQKIRFESESISTLSGVAQDKYVGVYYRCKGLQADRFSGKGYPEEMWMTLFDYALELTLGHELIFVLSDMIEEDAIGQKQVASEIGEILHLEVTSLKELEKKVAEIRRKFNRAVSNSALGRDPRDTVDGQTLVSHGELIFSIPKIYQKHIPELSNVACIYLIDEIENFSISHQEYVNTLVREKEPEVSIKIGARKYGVKTDITLSNREPLIEGSEKETVVLDDFYRKDENKGHYRDFLYKLLANRVNSTLNNVIIDNESSYLLGLFETYSPTWSDNRLLEITQKSKKPERPHRKKFKQNLKKFKILNGEKIVQLLMVEEFPLLEKVNIYSFYRTAEPNGDLVQLAFEIQNDCKKFIESNGTDSSTSTHGYLSHYRNNFVYQLRNDYGDKEFYSGLEDVILMSEGMPRNFLQILKKMYDWGYQLEKNPFIENQSDKFPLSVQRKAFRESSDWFFDDVRECKDRSKLIESISRLGQLLRINHYSDLPKECSCISIAIDHNKITEESKKMIQMAVDYSFLIDLDPHKDKNHQSNYLRKYQLNRMLCPIWDLPLARRGTKQLNIEESEVIFNVLEKDAEQFSELRDRWEKETSFIWEEQSSQRALL